MRSQGWTLAAALTAVCAILACRPQPSTDDPIVQTPVEKLTDADIARIRVRVFTNQGSFTIRLRPDWAPKTCRHFLTLAKSGYYNNLIFHDVVKGSWILGGDPLGNGAGDEASEFPFEPPLVPEARPHLRGRVGLFHHMPLKSRGWGQFFVLLSDLHEIDGVYALFGEVESGITTIDRIGRLPVAPKNKLRAVPVKPVIIKEMELLAVKSK
jgi:cyclophilin family peptidyl-prolyl cis-trans isomerase